MTGDTGKIRYPQRSKQIIDFSGIRFGNATPSNVDGLLELDNHFFVIFEFKHISAAKMSKGQRMMIERVCDAIHGRRSPSAYCVAIVAHHDAPSHQEIDAAKSKALGVRWDGEWLNVSQTNTTAMDQLSFYHNIAFNNPF